MELASGTPLGPPVFELRTASARWGDYGSVLAHGLAEWNKDADRTLVVSRTGPYCPPLSLPFGMGVVVTAELRSALANSELTGAGFLPVAKKKIVKLDWQRWDPSAPMPARKPLGGEPENYVLSGKHDEDTCANMPDLFELRPRQRVPFVVCGTEIKWGREWSVLRTSRAAWNGDDFFFGERGFAVYVTARARQWLEPCVGQHVVFAPVLWGP